MRAPLCLTLGAVPFEVWPDGRVLATLPTARMPFGAAITATVLYPSLRAFLDAALWRVRAP